jgi:hypothetical protein
VLQSSDQPLGGYTILERLRDDGLKALLQGLPSSGSSWQQGTFTAPTTIC